MFSAENVAVIFQDVSLTYRELDALTNSFANALLNQGIHKGEENRPVYDEPT